METTDYEETCKQKLQSTAATDHTRHPEQTFWRKS